MVVSGKTFAICVWLGRLVVLGAMSYSLWQHLIGSGTFKIAPV
jgi:hypothetical protein